MCGHPRGSWDARALSFVLRPRSKSCVRETQCTFSLSFGGQSQLSDDDGYESSSEVLGREWRVLDERMREAEEGWEDRRSNHFFHELVGSLCSMRTSYQGIFVRCCRCRIGGTG